MSLTPEEPLFRYPIDNTKFWLWEAEEGEGWTVGSGDHELAFRLPESTARLIAAAPELLAACEAVANDLESLLDGDDFSGMSDEELFAGFLRVLRPAINKAEGMDDG
jgi:hypothetical protein